MFISVTEIKIKSIFQLIRFFKYTFRVGKQLSTSPGLIKQQTRPQSLLVYQTLTAWDNKDAMMQFRNNAAHLEAMKITREIANKTISANWESDCLPDWKTAQQRLYSKAATK